MWDGFEWDEIKASRNVEKHGVTFGEAASAFGDPFSLTSPDPDHCEEEQRFILIGATTFRRIVVVVHSLRGENVRIISARLANVLERRAYDET